MVTFDFEIDIVKLDNSGQIAIYNTVTGDFITSYSPDYVKIATQTTFDTVKVTFDNNDAVYFRVDLVANTEIEPAAPVPFVGDVYDLAELLATDFFFDVSGGGGGDDLATVLIAGNSANNGIIDIDYLDFDTAAAHTVGVGELAWNNTDGTLDLGLKGGNVTLQIGQEQIVRVVNKTATNVNLLEANYQVVRITGAQGQRLKVDLALATTNALSAQTIGLVTETINNNQEGFITVSGLVRGINTTGSLQTETWADGDILYLSPTTAGNITNVKPIAPNHLIVIGYVVSAHITQGSIYVKVDNGYELDELHNVTIATPLNNDVLTYETSSSLWKNKRLPTEIQLAASDETTALTAGTAKVTFRMPYAMTVTEVRASLTTAQASGSIFTVDINEAGTSILSTKLTIDNTEKTSTTAATPAVISDTALADDAEITIDIDQIGNGTATGLKITIIGTR
jgi:hypothetical protein